MNTCITLFHPPLQHSKEIPLKVFSGNRMIKKGIMASSYSDLIEKCKLTLIQYHIFLYALQCNYLLSWVKAWVFLWSAIGITCLFVHPLQNRFQCFLQEDSSWNFKRCVLDIIYKVGLVFWPIRGLNIKETKMVTVMLLCSAYY